MQDQPAEDGEEEAPKAHRGEPGHLEKGANAHVVARVEGAVEEEETESAVAEQQAENEGAHVSATERVSGHVVRRMAGVVFSQQNGQQWWRWCSTYFILKKSKGRRGWSATQPSM